MTVHEINIKTITLTEADIKTALIFWLKERGYRELKEEDVSLDPTKVIAEIKITTQTEPSNGSATTQNT